MEEVTHPKYPVGFRFPSDDEKPGVSQECILCYTVPQPNSKVFLRGKSYTIIETLTPEHALVEMTGESEKWLVPLLTLKVTQPA